MLENRPVRFMKGIPGGIVYGNLMVSFELLLADFDPLVL